jgi:cytochrome c peroxidase
MLELDARAVDPMRAVLSRFELPRGAAGLALAEDEGIVVAVGAFRRAVRVFRLDGGRGHDVDLAWPQGERNPLVERGRELFHQTDDDRISAHGFACASCHPDGRADGLTWFTPVGPRQTLMLAGRLRDTAPYGWDRNERNVAAYVVDTTSRLGKGIHGIEARAIAAYVESLRVPDLGGSAGGSRLRQGAEVFARSGCSKCHAGSATTDNTSHDLGNGRARGASFDTPSLRYAKLTAPYFHDGRYPTLDALLQDAGHGMGETATLAGEESQALRLFLESL